MVRTEETVTLTNAEYEELMQALASAVSSRDEFEKKYVEADLRLKEVLKSRFRRASEAQSKDQLFLFDEAESGATEGSLDDGEGDDRNDVKDRTSREGVRKYVKHKSRSTLLSLPADTPIVEIHVPSEPGSCTECGAMMRKTGEKHQDSIVKTTLYTIVRRIYDVYECPVCEGSSGKSRVSYPGGNIMADTVCDPLLLADIVTSKMANGLPLYRQAEIFRRDGMDISYQTISSWMMRSGSLLLDNLKPVLEEEVFSYPLVNADETTIKVVGLEDEDGNRKAPDSRSNAYMLVRAGTDSRGRPGLVDFTFCDNRRNDTIEDFFRDYHGVLQTDGLSGYANAAKTLSFTHIGCLVHARRKAVEAAEGHPGGVAAQLVKMYGRIFHEEGILNDAYAAGTISEDEFLQKRKETLLPLLEQLREKCETTLRLGGTVAKKLQTACSYLISRYDSLIRFLGYSFATSSNQRAENQIRPFCVGRKAFLFCCTPSGAEVSALFYSLTESCKNLGLNPKDYLAHLFLNAGSVRNGDKEGWKALLPGRCDLADVQELKAVMLAAKPDESRTEPYVLRGKKI